MILRVLRARVVFRSTIQVFSAGIELKPGVWAILPYSIQLLPDSVLFLPVFPDENPPSFLTTQGRPGPLPCPNPSLSGESLTGVSSPARHPEVSPAAGTPAGRREEVYPGWCTTGPGTTWCTLLSYTTLVLLPAHVTVVLHMSRWSCTCHGGPGLFLGC